MTRFRISYRSVDLNLGNGDFVIGRDEQCSLVLDDSLVSRRHAVLRTGPDHVVVEDLGSRNGIRVNGTRISGKASLRVGDTMRIGSQDFTIRDAPVIAKHATGTLDVLLCPRCNTPADAADVTCTQCGMRLESVAKTLVDLEVPKLDAPADNAKQRSAVAVLAGLVDKALTLKRYDEAERILSSLIGNVIAQAEGGQADEANARRAASLALLVAEPTGRAQWLEYPFRVYGAIGKLMPAEVIDTLYRLVASLRFTDPTALRAYLAGLRVASQAYGPNERFLLRRLEGLERLIVSV